jgi:hypothetical protein
MLAKGSEESFEREGNPDACGEEAVSGNGVVESLSEAVSFIRVLLDIEMQCAHTDWLVY